MISMAMASPSSCLGGAKWRRSCDTGVINAAVLLRKGVVISLLAEGGGMTRYELHTSGYL